MDRRTAIQTSRIAAEEVLRARDQMRITGHPRPYLVSVLIRDLETWRLQARYGSLIHDRHDRDRNAYMDVRVGSYRSDQVRDGGLHDNSRDAESTSHADLPFENSGDGLRHGLWRLADARYREAVEALLDKRSHELTFLDTNQRLQAFQRLEPVVELGWSDLPQVDPRHWAGVVQRLSKALRKYPEVKDSHVELEAQHEVRVFASSEGTRRLACQSYWSLDCYLWMLSAKGDGFSHTVRYFVTDPDELPDERTFARRVRRDVGRLREMAGAPVLRSYCGPALLDPVPAGLLMHEAVGHRLEGNRLLDAGEGQTFKDSVGQRILPEFLTLHDDPSVSSFEGRSLVGHYPFDDEGTTAGDARLVEDGVLKGFLTGRTGVMTRHRSNGHARGSTYRRPISRMGNLFVEASDGLDDGELKEALLAEIRRKELPFGLRVMDATNGETSTEAYDFQAFLGEVNRVARVFPDGREELVRGVNFVGTPLNAVRGIVAAGRRCEVDNAYCSAESGDVPVSTISPALLVSELEMQSKPDVPYTQFSFPSPWAKSDR